MDAACCGGGNQSDATCCGGGNQSDAACCRGGNQSGAFDFQQKVMSYWYFRAAWNIGLFTRFGILPSGLVTNTLSFLVMTMRHNRRSTTSVYMSVLAVGDNMVLSLNLITGSFQYIPSFTFLSDPFCKFFVVCYNVTTTFSAYTIVFMTYDKFCAIIFPHRTNELCTKKRVFKFTCLNMATALLLNSPLIFTSETRPNIWCVRYPFVNWYIKLHSALCTIYYPVLPFLVLLFFNFSIIRALYKRKSVVTKQSQRAKAQEKQLTVMLLLVSFMFILLLLPFEIRAIVQYLFTHESTPLYEAKKTFILFATLCPQMLNYAINFYLYLLAGSKFRKDLKALVCCNKVSTSTERATSSSQGTSASTSDVRLSSTETEGQITAISEPRGNQV